MKRKFALPLALLIALLPSSQAGAEEAFLGAFGGGRVPGAMSSGDKGTATFTAMGVWMEQGASGNTELEIELPEGVVFTGDPIPQVWNSLVAEARHESRTSTQVKGTTGGVQWVTESDVICGVYGYDIDPTTGELYALLGRYSGNPQSCYRTADRWLAKYDGRAGVFKWIGSMGRFRGIEFLADGSLVGVASNGGPNGNSSIHSVNKSSAATTYRVATSGNNHGDVIYNPGDGYVYSIDQCYLRRINPAGWATSNVYVGDLCDAGYRGTSTLFSNNRFYARGYNNTYLVDINPADGAYVSRSLVGSGNNYKRNHHFQSDTDLGSAAGSCILDGTKRRASCTFSSVNARGIVVVAGGVAYDIPADAPAGVREGKLSWNGSTGAIASQAFELRVLAPDVEVEMTPTSGRYFVNDTFGITVDLTAVGGKGVDSVTASLTLPESLSVVSVAGPGTCGLSTEGARCLGFSIGADSTATVTVTVRAEEDGVANVVAGVKVAAGDVNANNDSAKATFVIGDAADLAVSGTRGGVGAVGKAVELALEVTNEGPDAVTDAALVIPGDAGFDLGTATTDTGTCAAAGDGIKCVLGALAVDAVAKVSLKVTPNRTGNLTLSSVASSSYVDAVSGNNAHALAVSVPTAPFTVALGAATPGATSGDVRPVLQVALTPASGSKDALRVTAIAGTVTVSAKGLALKDRVFVYEDRDGNGLKDDGDPYLGSASLAAADGSFTLQFEGSITIEPGKTANFILAVQREGAPVVAGLPFGTGTNWMGLALAGLLPLAFAGLAFGRRRAAMAVAGVIAITFVGACSTVEELFDTASVTATVTEVTATLLEDLDSPVNATGLPVSGPAITLGR